MEAFFETQLCSSRINCEDCRKSEQYRKGIILSFKVDGIDFKCPHGITEKNLEAKIKSGEVKRRPSPVSLLERAFDQGRAKAEPSSEAEKKKRLSICRKCSNFNEIRMRCRSCGCGLKGKFLLKAAKCPDNKW
jgi:hypothetical protein